MKEGKKAHRWRRQEERKNETTRQKTIMKERWRWRKRRKKGEARQIGGEETNEGMKERERQKDKKKEGTKDREIERKRVKQK